MCNDVSFGEGKNPFNLQQKLEECGIQFDYQTVENIFLSNEGLNLPLENSFVVDAISEELGIEDAEQKDIIVKLFDAVSQNDDEEGLSLNDFMLQQKTDLFLERQGIAQQFNSDEWVEIENPSEVYAGTGLPFEFEGAKIFFDAPTDAIIKYNSNTNEIVIIGGQGVYLELAEGQSLTVFDTVDCAIYANPGESNITISGPNCVVTKLETYAGAKNVVVDKGATLENVVFGNGDDSITVVDATIGNVNMGSGNDKLSLSGATVVGIINLGDGDDELSSTSSQLLKKINLGEGYDTAVFDDTQIFGDIDDNDGSHVEFLNGSVVDKNSDLNFAGDSTDIIVDSAVVKGTITDSSLDGQVQILNEAQVRSLFTVKNYSDVIVNNAMVGNFKSAYQIAYNGQVKHIDTSVGGEYEGFIQYSPDSSNCEHLPNNNFLYTLN